QGMEDSRQSTVLFADVSGSTQLYQVAGDTTAHGAISGCLELMRKAVEGARGRVVKTIGDEVMALFPSADAAVAAAATMLGAVDAMTLGRESGCGLTVADHLASRRHCTIERRQDKWVLKDHSSNGTFVTIEGDAEIMLQREEMMLRRSGWISLGHPRAEGGEAVEYTCA